MKTKRINQLEQALITIINRADNDDTKSILYAIEDAKSILEKDQFADTLSEIGNAYESVKDVLNAMFEDMSSDEFDKAMDGITKLRDIAATQLKENYER